jgi:hypothetical protein
MKMQREYLSTLSFFPKFLTLFYGTTSRQRQRSSVGHWKREEVEEHREAEKERSSHRKVEKLTNRQRGVGRKRGREREACHKKSKTDANIE